MINNIVINIGILSLSLYVIIISLIAFTDLVTKLREVFPRKYSDKFEEEVYKPLNDYDDGFVEDEKNYDNRINEMKAELDSILKPEIITDEYEKSLEK